ncbi:MAG: hypothetical protein ABJM06_04160 [Gilvibacter sp.]
MSFLKTLLIVSVLTSSIAIAQTQDTITISFDKQLQFLDSSVSSDFKIPYTVQVKGNKFPNAKDSIYFSISTSIAALNPFIKNSKILLSQSIVKGNLEFDPTKNKDVAFKTLVDSIFNNQKKIELNLESISKNKFGTEDNETKIIISKSKLTIVLQQNPIKQKAEYNFYAGANFDLKEQLKASSFYSEIDVFIPGIIFKNKKTGAYVGGLRAGIYKNTSVSTEKENTFSTEVLTITENDTSLDSVTIASKTVQITPKTTFDNLGLYASLLIRLHNSTDNKFQLYIAPYAEVIQRSEKTEFDSKDLVELSTSRISRDTLNSSRIQTLLNKTNEANRKFYTSYYGLAFTAKFKNKHFEMLLNPTFGVGDIGFNFRGKNKLQLFGAMQFYLKERKYGIKLGGDIRKYFNINQSPFLVVTLSKSISLDSLISSGEKSDD